VTVLRRGAVPPTSWEELRGWRRLFQLMKGNVINSVSTSDSAWDGIRVPGLQARPAQGSMP
jgi:beta-galactosidase GanA